MEKTTQLVGRNETTQLCTAVDRLDRLQPPTTAYNRLQPPATAYNRLQPPATAHNRLQPPATAYNRLQPPAPPAPPLQQNRLFLPTYLHWKETMMPNTFTVPAEGKSYLCDVSRLNEFFPTRQMKGRVNVNDQLFP
ncbi:hypothetical protein TNCV_1047681 [Trichonephila clavipes]|nr:hypothetical protein TNCV_1047681 [Trichonephila clavipes]